jgi:hypothetical protein
MPRRGNYSIMFESISEKKLMESMNESRILKIKKIAKQSKNLRFYFIKFAIYKNGAALP